MSNIQNTTTANMRVDYGTATNYLGPEAPKKTFWQKLGQGLAKGMSFLGPIGAAVTAVALPGIGLPLAAGIYGLTRFSQDKLQQSQMKDQMEMASQGKPTSISFPGLFDSSPVSAGMQATNFIAPSSLSPQINDVIINRDAAQQEAGVTFQVPERS